MMKINSSKTFVVKPAEKTPPGRTIPLSLIDRLYHFPRYNSTVHIYRPTVKVNAESLRESLSKVLVHFYPVAGRYVRPENDNVTEIHCNDEGVHYVEVESDSVVDDLGDLAPSLDFKSLVPFIDYTQPHISSYPIMLVQVTYFRCGGVSLGIAMEHCTLDGSSAFHLINSWSEICRGGLDVSVPPFLDRTLLLRPRDPPQPRFDHQEYIFSREKISDESSDHYKVSVFRLTKDQIEEMKAEANKNQLETTTRNFTTFEVLAGHTWKCVSKARGVASDQVTRLLFPVDMRSDKRAGPLVPRGFFGNAIVRAVPKARAGDLKSEPLQYAASVIRDALARIDTEYTRSVLDFLAIQLSLSAARSGPPRFGSPDFLISSWVRLGLNDADFGWGPLVYSGPGWIQAEKAHIFSCDHVDGGLSLAIRLKAQHMEVFEKLFYEFA